MPWRWATDYEDASFVGDNGAVAALVDGVALFIEDGASTVSVPVPGMVAGASAPDGKALATRDATTSETHLVTPEGTTALPACNASSQLAFLPASVTKDAEEPDRSPRAVGIVDGVAVDCITGRTWTGVLPEFVDEYAVSAKDGHVAYRGANDDLVWTEWRNGGSSRTVTYTPDSPVGAVAWSSDGEWLAYAAKNNREIAILQQGSGGWSLSQNIHTQVGDIAAASFLTDGGLLLAMGASGEFQLLDAPTGRQVLSGSVRVISGVTGLSSVQYDGLAVVAVELADNSDGYASNNGQLTIPLSTDRLRAELCWVHRLSACDGKS